MPAFRPNSVTVSSSAAADFTSTPAVWWQNPVVAAQSGITSVAEHDVIVTRAGAGGLHQFSTSKVALVIEPGTVLTRGNNRIIGVTAASGKTGFITGSTAGGRHVILDSTAVNQTKYGFRVEASTTNTMMNLLAANNERGFSVYGSNTNVVQNLVSSNNSMYGVSFESANASVAFGGILHVASNGTTDCYATGGTQGIDANCAMTGSSTATFAAKELSGSFVGKVTSDASNPDDVDGAASFDAIGDFHSFDRRERGWGKEGTGPFPQLDQQGACTTGLTCRIWDFALLAADTSARAVAPLPTGNDVLVHRWAYQPVDQAGCDAVLPGSVYTPATIGYCSVTFLRHAVELLGDGIGNDNGLCESAETCVYSPNAGSYQGHGSLVSAGTFVDGTISGVTLLRYETNGY